MPSYPTDNPDPSIYDVPVLEGMTSPSKRPFETFPNLAAALHELENKANESGLWDNLKWRLVLDEIDRAIVTERNEAMSAKPTDRCRVIACEFCEGDGRLEYGAPRPPYGDYNSKRCNYCNGTGVQEIVLEPITMDDLEENCG